MYTILERSKEWRCGLKAEVAWINSIGFSMQQGPSTYGTLYEGHFFNAKKSLIFFFNFKNMVLYNAMFVVGIHYKELNLCLQVLAHYSSCPIITNLLALVETWFEYTHQYIT